MPAFAIVENYPTIPSRDGMDLKEMTVRPD